MSADFAIFLRLDSLGWVLVRTYPVHSLGNLAKIYSSSAAPPVLAVGRGGLAYDNLYGWLWQLGSECMWSATLLIPIPYSFLLLHPPLPESLSLISSPGLFLLGPLLKAQRSCSLGFTFLDLC